jgi:hypothetical protein
MPDNCFRPPCMNNSMNSSTIPMYSRPSIMGASILNQRKYSLNELHYDKGMNSSTVCFESRVPFRNKSIYEKQLQTSFLGNHRTLWNWISQKTWDIITITEMKEAGCS